MSFMSFSVVHVFLVVLSVQDLETLRRWPEKGIVKAVWKAFRKAFRKALRKASRTALRNIFRKRQLTYIVYCHFA